jgi:threonine dehydratase
MLASVHGVPIDLPTYDDVVAAAGRISSHLVRTPLLHHRWDDRDVWIKPEVLQRTGSFKARGALNFMASLAAEDRARGVVAYSSGNHAQGVAAAAAVFGIPATIVMPTDAPRVKAENTRALGARVVPYDREGESREQIAASIAADTGAVLVPPYDHPWIVAGQGTVGLEIAADLERAGVSEALVVVPASGGGLSAGISLAVEPSSAVRGVMTAEPATHDDHRQSLAAGHRVSLEDPEPSICDALLQPTPGEITFAVNRDRLLGGLVASDSEVLEAMAFAATRLKLTVEPGGAVGLAALLQGRVSGSDPVVVVLSGGNVDPGLLHRALAGAGSR